MIESVFSVLFSSLWSEISKQREMLNESPSSILTLLLSFIKICSYIRLFSIQRVVFFKVFDDREMFVYIHTGK